MTVRWINGIPLVPKRFCRTLRRSSQNEFHYFFGKSVVSLWLYFNIFVSTNYLTVVEECHRLHMTCDVTFKLHISCHSARTFSMASFIFSLINTHQDIFLLLSCNYQSLKKLRFGKNVCIYLFTFFLYIICKIFMSQPMGRGGGPRRLSWMRRPTGDQEVAGSTPAEVGHILSWRLIMKYFLRSFSPFRWFKKGSCQFLAKECAQYWLTT